MEKFVFIHMNICICTCIHIYTYANARTADCHCFPLWQASPAVYTSRILTCISSTETGRQDFSFVSMWTTNPCGIHLYKRLGETYFTATAKESSLAIAMNVALAPLFIALQFHMDMASSQTLFALMFMTINEMSTVGIMVMSIATLTLGTSVGRPVFQSCLL